MDSCKGLTPATSIARPNFAPFIYFPAAQRSLDCFSNDEFAENLTGTTITARTMMQGNVLDVTSLANYYDRSNT